MAMSNYPGGFGGGVTIQNVPIQMAVPNKVFWVDSNGGGGSKGTFDHPVATLAAALDLCTASKGDVIMLKAGHSESPVVTIDLDIAGVSIIGLGVGRNRPTFIPTFTVASDIVFNVSADDILFKNIIVEDGTNTGGNSNQFSVSANNFTMEDCLIEQGAINLVAVVLVSGYDEFTARRCLFLGTAANPDVAIQIGSGSGDCENFTASECVFNYMGSSGLDLGGIWSTKINTGILIEHCTFIGMDDAGVNFASNATGLINRCVAYSTVASVNEMFIPGTCGASECYGTYNSVQGILAPATTATT